MYDGLPLWNHCPIHPRPFHIIKRHHSSTIAVDCTKAPWLRCETQRLSAHQRSETAVHDAVFCSCNSTNTSSPSIITSYRVRRLEHLAGPSPVLGSKRHRCHGQTILPSSILPCPRGPPQCRQVLSVAYMLSSTFATHSILPDAMNSFTLPRSGNSDLTAILISIMLGLSAVSIVSGSC